MLHDHVLNALLTPFKSAELTPSTSTQPPGVVAAARPVPELVQYLTKGEYQPKISHISSKHYSDEHRGHEQHDYNGMAQYQGELNQTSQHDSPSSLMHSQHHHQSHDDHGHEVPVSDVNTQQPEPPSSVSSDVISSLSNNENTPAEVVEEQIHAQGSHVDPTEVERKSPPSQPSMSSWDAQRLVFSVC